MRLKINPYLLNVILLLLAVLFSVAIGPVFIPPASLARLLAGLLPGFVPPIDLPEAFSAILFKVRLPHTALILLTGAALGGSGAAYQGLFRNPLADPYLIGVASGAGLGAVAAMAIHWPSSLFGLYAIPAAAFIGALVTVALVYSLARIGNNLPTTTLILAGVAISSFATSLTSFLMLRSSNELRRAIGWLLGGAVMSGWEPVLAALPYILIGLSALLFSGHALNVLQFGEEQAQQLGLPAERVKAWLILAASLTTAAAVAFSGIIGFIGLIVPHLARMLWGADYRRLIPLSILGGGSALLLADLLARVVLAPQVLPVGIVTALAGAPFFLWVLRRARRQAFW
ncbi:MAG: iron ABC transporter permease [Anaerolineales bacterium]|nr:iron ABC transporter permease [Anaerolineales bacterium]